MVETLKHNNIPFDEGNYQLIEYLDNYSNGDGKKVKVKDLGKKVALNWVFAQSKHNQKLFFTSTFRTLTESFIGRRVLVLLRLFPVLATVR